MAMKPKKVSSAAKKPVKRMRGGGMVAMKEPVKRMRGGGMVAMKKGGAAGAMKDKQRFPKGRTAADRAAGAGSVAITDIAGIQASMRSLAKELGILGAGAGAGASTAALKKGRAAMTKAGKAKAKGRGPK